MEGLDEDDPRQAAQAMRLLYREAGLPMTPTVEEAVSRLEAGEDPDQVEQELGQALDEEDLFGANKGKGRLRKLRNRLLPPRVDDKLYRL